MGAQAGREGAARPPESPEGRGEGRMLGGVTPMKFQQSTRYCCCHVWHGPDFNPNHFFFKKKPLNLALNTTDFRKKRKQGTGYSSRYFGSLFGDMGKFFSRINITCMQMCLQDSAVLGNMLIYAT